jgi:hypothetical protein
VPGLAEQAILWLGIHGCGTELVIEELGSPALLDIIRGEVLASGCRVVPARAPRGTACELVGPVIFAVYVSRFGPVVVHCVLHGKKIKKPQARNSRSACLRLDLFDNPEEAGSFMYRDG